MDESGQNQECSEIWGINFYGKLQYKAVCYIEFLSGLRLKSLKSLKTLKSCWKFFQYNLQKSAEILNSHNLCKS